MKKSKDGKYGIETLKKFSLILIRLAMKLEAIKWGWKGILFSLVPFVLRNYKLMLELWKNKDQILLEMKDIDEGEKLELRVYISAKLKLQDAKIEEIIETGMEVIEVISNKIRNLINLIRNGKAKK